MLSNYPLGLNIHYSHEASFIMPHHTVKEPPVKFTNIVPPHMEPYVDEMVLYLANDIITGQDIHEGRMFYLNQMSENKWHNENFKNLVILAIGFLDASVQRKHYQTPEQGLREVVKHINSLVSSRNIAIYYPHLQCYLTPQNVMCAKLNVMKLAEIERDIDTLSKNLPLDYPARMPLDKPVPSTGYVAAHTLPPELIAEVEVYKASMKKQPNMGSATNQQGNTSMNQQIPQQMGMNQMGMNQMPFGYMPPQMGVPAPHPYLDAMQYPPTQMTPEQMQMLQQQQMMQMQQMQQMQMMQQQQMMQQMPQQVPQQSQYMGGYAGFTPNRQPSPPFTTPIGVISTQSPNANMGVGMNMGNMGFNPNQFQNPNQNPYGTQNQPMQQVPQQAVDPRFNVNPYLRPNTVPNEMIARVSEKISSRYNNRIVEPNTDTSNTQTNTADRFATDDPKEMHGARQGRFFNGAQTVDNTGRIQPVENNPSYSRFGRDQEPQVSQTQVDATQPTSVVQQAPVELVWKPSPIQRNMPLYDKDIETAELKEVLMDGKLYVVMIIREKTEKEIEMDRAQHTIPVTTNAMHHIPAPGNVAPAKVLEEEVQRMKTESLMKETNTKMVYDADKDEFVEVPGEGDTELDVSNSVNKDNIKVVMTVDEAIFTSDVKWKNDSMFDTRANIHVGNYFLARPSYNELNHQPFINEFINTPNLVAGARLIRSTALDRMQPNDIKYLLKVLDVTMTDAVNEYIKQVMNLPGLYMDAYVDDMVDMIEHIRKNYGDQFADHLAQLKVSNFLTEVSTELHDALVDDLTEEKDLGIYNYIAKDIIVANVGMSSSELSLSALNSNSNSFLIEEGSHKLLHSVVEEIFNCADSKTIDYYLRTDDLRVYKIAKTPIGAVKGNLIYRVK